MRHIMLAAPDTHFISLSQVVLFRGAGLNVVWAPLLARLVIGAVLFGLSLTRIRKTLGTMT